MSLSIEIQKKPKEKIDTTLLVEENLELKEKNKILSNKLQEYERMTQEEDEEFE